MPWIQVPEGGESGAYVWENTETGQRSYTDPQIAVDAGIAALMNKLSGGSVTGFGSSPPAGWRWEPGQPNGESTSPGRWYVKLPGYNEISIDPYLGRESTWDKAFGDNPEHPDNALGFMIMSGYNQDLIRALIRSNPTAFNKIGIIEKDLPYWLEKARKQEEIGQAINAREASDPLGMAGLALIGGLAGAGGLWGSLGSTVSGEVYSLADQLAEMAASGATQGAGTAADIAAELAANGATQGLSNNNFNFQEFLDNIDTMDMETGKAMLENMNISYEDFLKQLPNIKDVSKLAPIKEMLGDADTDTQEQAGDTDTDTDGHEEQEQDTDNDGDTDTDTDTQEQDIDKDISDVLDEDDILDALDKYFKGTGGGTDWGKLLAGLIGGKQTSDIADKFLARDRETKDRDLARRQPWYDTANQQRSDAWGWMKSNWGPMTDELMRRSAGQMSYKGFNQSGTGAANMTNQVLGGLLPQFNDNYKLNLNAAGLMGDPNAAMKEANDLFKTGMGLQQQANQNYGFAAREATSGILGGIRGDMGETISNIIKEYGLT